MAAFKDAVQSDLIRYYHNRPVFSHCFSTPALLLLTFPFGLQFQALIEGTCSLLTEMESPHRQPRECAEAVSVNVEGQGLLEFL